MTDVACVPGVNHHPPSERDHSHDSPQLESVEEPDSDIDTNASNGDTDEGDSDSVEAYRAFPELGQSLDVGLMFQGPDASESSRWDVGTIVSGCRLTFEDFVQVLYSQCI